MGSVQSYGVALFEIELTAAKAPGDYAIVNRQTGERTVLSFGLSVDGHHHHVEPIGRQNGLVPDSPAIVDLGTGATRIRLVRKSVKLNAVL
jgi:hypothetical protein